MLTLHDIEVVHLHNLVGLGVDSILAAKAAGRRVVVTLHDHWGFCLRQSLLRPDGSLCGNTEECAVCLESFVHEGERLPIRLRRDFVAWALEQADHLISPSRYLAAAYHGAGVAPGRIEVISNGIDVDALPEPQPRPAVPLQFLCSAHLGRHKGIGVLLDALRMLQQDPELRGRWRLTLAGEGPLHAEAEAAASELAGEGTAAPLTVTGHVPRAELLACMSGADVVMLPSIWPENEPVTLLEGAAAGAALLVTASGGSADLVEEGVTGLKVPPGDAAALAAAMRRLVLEPGLAARLGAANAARRPRLDESHSVSRLEALYAAPASTGPHRPVVLVGQGEAPQTVIRLIGQLHQHILPAVAPRLLRHDWVSQQGWEEARLLWLWSGTGAQEAALRALRQGIPVLAPRGLGLELWARADGPVILYDTPLEAMAALQVLLEHPPIRDRLAAEADLSTDAVWAAPREAFALHAEGLG